MDGWAGVVTTGTSLLISVVTEYRISRAFGVSFSLVGDESIGGPDFACGVRCFRGRKRVLVIMSCMAEPSATKGTRPSLAGCSYSVTVVAQYARG